MSVMANPNCPDKESAERAVNEVWESCFNDTRPFDEVRLTYYSHPYPGKLTCIHRYIDKLPQPLQYLKLDALDEPRRYSQNVARRGSHMVGERSKSWEKIKLVECYIRSCTPRRTVMDSRG